MTTIMIPIQQSEKVTQIVLSEQTMDTLARLMVDRLIQLGILEEQPLEEYLIGTSELAKNLKELRESPAKTERLLTYKEV